MSFTNFPLENYFAPAINKGHTIGDKLMIVLHGRGDSLTSYKTIIKEINVTGLNYLLLNAPFKEYFGYTWYDDSFDIEDEKYKASILKLNEVLKSCHEFFLPENIFLMGFSQGGRMAMDLFLHQEKKLAGVLALSPRVTKWDPPFQLNSDQIETPAFIAHGKMDPIIPYNETENNLDLWQKQLKDFQFKGYDLGHEIDIFEIQDVRDWLNERL